MATEVEEVLKSKGFKESTSWYNPIGITIKNGGNAEALKRVVDKVKSVLSHEDDLSDYNLDSPSDFAKALMAFVLKFF